MAKGRKTGGRRPGSRNRVTFDARTLALPYAPASMELLATMAGLTSEPGSDNDAVRVACAKEILDRAYGKATQQIAGDPQHPIVHEFVWGGALTDVLDSAPDAEPDIVWNGNGHDHG